MFISVNILNTCGVAVSLPLYKSASLIAVIHQIKGKGINNLFYSGPKRGLGTSIAESIHAVEKLSHPVGIENNYTFRQRTHCQRYRLDSCEVTRFTRDLIVWPPHSHLIVGRPIVHELTPFDSGSAFNETSRSFPCSGLFDTSPCPIECSRRLNVGYNGACVQTYFYYIFGNDHGNKTYIKVCCLVDLKINVLFCFNLFFF